MTKHAPVLGLGAAALVLGILLLAGGGSGGAADDKMIWKPVLADKDVNYFVQRLGQLVQDEIKTGPPKADDVKKALKDKLGRDPKEDEVAEVIQQYYDRMEGSAAMVVVLSQSVKGDAKALREAAYKLQEALVAKKFDDAKKLAAELGNAKIDPKGNPNVEPLKEKVGLGEVMKLLKLKSNGGIGTGGKTAPDGIEAQLIGLARKELPKDQYMRRAEEIRQMALLMAAISQLADEHTPTKAKPKQDPKDWKQYVEEMRKESIALAEAKDPAAVKKAATALHSSCVSCHTKFRD